MNDYATHSPAASPAEVLQGALIDSRQRWRELINLVADFAFETDEWGRFTLVTPDPALDWGAGALIGQNATSILVEVGDASFDPFRVTARVRHRQAWLKRGDGGVACLTFCTAPIRDAAGRVTGARGVGIDTTEADDQAVQMASALRRAEVLDLILWRIGQEVTVPAMMDALFDVLANAIGAEGIAIVIAATAQEPARVAYTIGTGAEAVARVASQQQPPRQPRSNGTSSPVATIVNERPVLIAACHTRFGVTASLIAWRQPNSRLWDADDSYLVGSTAHLCRMILEREAIQMDMSRLARTDPLTGLLNRRAFLEEVERHASRQDRENQPSTLLFADLDHFKPVNDRLGHEAGDDVLRHTAALLRKTFRPGDLIARLGGDEFAVWLNGADHMTAAERAEHLRDAVPREMADLTGPDLPGVTMSIGIASKEPGDGETLDSLMRRADRAMYKRSSAAVEAIGAFRCVRDRDMDQRETTRDLARDVALEAARVRLSAQPDTSPEVLHALATDVSVTVRASVALNAATPPETNASLAGDTDERVRALVARKLGLLVPSLSAKAQTTLWRQTLDTLTALARDEAVRVRGAIAEAVKNLPEAPRALILRLAYDAEAMVSEPVIRFSPLLTTDDLVALVAAAPSPDTGVAVARRSSIDNAVSDAVAAGGTDDAVLALLMNGTAQIREATLDALVERSIEHPDWHDPLVRRPVLSNESVKTLSDIVADHLLGLLAERSDLDPALTAELRARVRTRLQSIPLTAEAGAARIQPTESDLLIAARDGDARKAAGMLASAAGVPLSAVRRAATLRSAKGLLSLTWKAGFSMQVGYAMQILLAGLPPGAALRAGPGNSFPLSIQEMNWQVNFLRGEQG